MESKAYSQIGSSHTCTTGHKGGIKIFKHMKLFFNLEDFKM